MYVAASLCTALLRIWKARSTGKSQEVDFSLASDSPEQPDVERRVSSGDESDIYFNIGKARFWKRV
jgi:hypothetical protein